MNMVFERKLTIPAEVKEMHPLTKEVVNTVETKRQEIKNVFAGKDNRLLLIIGPCSADKEESVLDYINRLKPVQEKVKDKILICPRIYTINLVLQAKVIKEWYINQIQQENLICSKEFLQHARFI